jgi:uncharacterized protein
MPVLPEKLPLRGVRVPFLSAPRSWLSFSWKEADLRISSTRAEEAAGEIRSLRALLEAYIERHPLFLSSLVPLAALPDAPAVAVRMAEAAARASVGPMAAVAGAMAQAAVEAALAAGAEEAVVENGGDIYLCSPRPVLVGLYAGKHPLSGRLAFRVEPDAMPLSVCASSGRFGHSFSFGDCNLAVAVAFSGALADAVATLGANSVCGEGDVEAALERMTSVPGIRGALIIQGDKVGLMGDLPPLVRSKDPRFADKTFHTQPG